MTRHLAQQRLHGGFLTIFSPTKYARLFLATTCDDRDNVCMAFFEGHLIQTNPIKTSTVMPIYGVASMPIKPSPDRFIPSLLFDTDLFHRPMDHAEEYLCFIGSSSATPW